MKKRERINLFSLLFILQNIGSGLDVKERFRPDMKDI